MKVIEVMEHAAYELYDEGAWMVVPVCVAATGWGTVSPRVRSSLTKHKGPVVLSLCQELTPVYSGYFGLDLKNQLAAVPAKYAHRVRPIALHKLRIIVLPISHGPHVTASVLQDSLAQVESIVYGLIRKRNLVTFILPHKAMGIDTLYTKSVLQRWALRSAPRTLLLFEHNSSLPNLFSIATAKYNPGIIEVKTGTPLDSSVTSKALKYLKL